MIDLFKKMSIMKGARIAVETCMNIKPEETVLVVTDTGKLNIAEAFVYAAASIEAKTVMTLMAPTKEHGREPLKPVAEAMKAADVVLIPTSRSLSHTDARRNATKKGVRIASMPGITESMMSTGALTADYTQIAKLTNKVADALERGRNVEIATPSGTRLTMAIEGRPPLRDTGLYHKRGDWGNLPAGEACLAPIEGTTQGTLVIDHMGSTVTQPLKVVVKDGLAKEFEGPDASKLESRLKAADKNAFNVGELGIGTNPKARLTGVVLEDEKALGTVHIALGDNTSYEGGHTKSNIHLDGILLKPTVKIDGHAIMRSGRLFFH